MAPPKKDKQKQKQSKMVTDTDSSSTARDTFHYGAEKDLLKIQKLAERINLYLGTSAARSLAREIVQAQTRLDQEKEDDGSVSPKYYNQEASAKYHQFLSSWDSISAEKKKGILVIGVQDLRNHLIRITSSSQFRDSLMENFEEAIENGRKSKMLNCWEFWLCPYCDVSFTDSNSQEDHLKVHEEERVELTRIDELTAEWAKEVLEHKLEPVDVPKALELLGDQRQDLTVADLGKLKWPVCDDSERVILLIHIQDLFRELIKKRHLASTDATYLMCYTAQELQSIIPESFHEGLRKEIAKSHLSMRLLKAPRLRKIQQFLQSLSAACDSILDIPNKKDTYDYADLEAYGMEVEESIDFSLDKSSLILDERIITSPWAFLDWPFRGPTIGDEIQRWTSLKSKRRALLAQFKENYKGSESLLKYTLQRIYDDSDQRLEYQNFEYILDQNQNLVMGQVPLEHKWIDTSNVGRSYAMKKLSFKIRYLSRLDYRSLLLPLVKSFLQDNCADMLGEGQEEDVNQESASGTSTTPSAENLSESTSREPKEDAETHPKFASNTQA